MKDITNMLKGLLEGCVLEIISRKEIYGYEITRKLNELGFSDVVEGTVYAILGRLTYERFVSVKKGVSDQGPPRKFYSITEPGQSALIRFWNKWDFVSERINKLREQNNCV